VIMDGVGHRGSVGGPDSGGEDSKAMLCGR